MQQRWKRTRLNHIVRNCLALTVHHLADEHPWSSQVVWVLQQDSALARHGTTDDGCSAWTCTASVTTCYHASYGSCFCSMLIANNVTALYTQNWQTPLSMMTGLAPPSLKDHMSVDGGLTTSATVCYTHHDTLGAPPSCHDASDKPKDC